MREITPGSPARGEVIPDKFGGLTLKLIVPTYSGEAVFRLQAERDEKHGDWRVYIPWKEGLSDEIVTLEGGYKCANGILYLGAPDVTILRCPSHVHDAGDLVGCGGTHVEGPDSEGFYDCRDCGLFFKEGS